MKLRNAFSLPCLLALVYASLLAGCSSATVVERSDVPQVKDVPGAGSYTWNEDAGWVRPREGNWGNAPHIRAESRKAFDGGAHADALAGLLALKDRLPSDDPSLAETNFLIAECYYHLGNYDDAIEYYSEVYKKNRPPQDILDKTFQRIYDIAMDYLRGKASCEIILISYNCPGRGIEILVGEQGLITQYPYLTFADDALMEIAGYYFGREEYPEAVPFYERVAQDPKSEWRELAEYQLGLATFKQIRGADYDQKIILESEQLFRRYLEDQPRGPQAESVREKLAEIAEMQGDKNLGIAKFYLRESQIRAARVYLRVVLDRYATSTAAREAREIQRQLDAMEGEG